jgi:hypothetical protein
MRHSLHGNNQEIELNETRYKIIRNFKKKDKRAEHPPCCYYARNQSPRSIFQCNPQPLIKINMLRADGDFWENERAK